MYNPNDLNLPPDARITPLLRFVEVPLRDHPGRTRRLLQQGYLLSDNQVVYRDVPYIRLEEDPNAR